MAQFGAKHSFNRGRDPVGIFSANHESQGILGRGLGGEKDINVVMAQTKEHSAENVGSNVKIILCHQGHQARFVNSRHRLHRRAVHVRSAGDFGPGNLRPEGVLDPNGNFLFHGGTNGFVMNDLGPVVGKLDGFGKADLREHSSVGADARVGAEDAVNIGPDPDFIAFDNSTENRRRRI